MNTYTVQDQHSDRVIRGLSRAEAVRTACERARQQGDAWYVTEDAYAGEVIAVYPDGGSEQIRSPAGDF
jgi:hypothetical protein